MNYTVTCTAAPHSAFSPFFFLFYVSRYRPSRWVKWRGVTGSQKNLLSTTIHITTNITSFDVDLIVYDGLLASYISNVILESPSRCSSGVTSRQIDKEHMIWGTRLLPVRSDAGSNAVYMNVDMGYLHPGEHHYQTLATLWPHRSRSTPRPWRAYL